MSVQQKLPSDMREVWFKNVAQFLSVRTLSSKFWNEMNDRQLETIRYVISNSQQHDSVTGMQNSEFYSDSQIEKNIALKASDLLQLAIPVKVIFGSILDSLVVELNATAKIREDEATITTIEVKSRRSLLVKLREKRNMLLHNNYNDNSISRGTNGNNRSSDNINNEFNYSNCNNNSEDNSNNNNSKDTNSNNNDNNDNNTSRENYDHRRGESSKIKNHISSSDITTHINDTVRSSIICTSSAQILSLLDLLSDSEKRGLFTVVKFKNRYHHTKLNISMLYSIYYSYD